MVAYWAVSVYIQSFLSFQVFDFMYVLIVKVLNVLTFDLVQNGVCSFGLKGWISLFKKESQRLRNNVKFFKYKNIFKM